MKFIEMSFFSTFTNVTQFLQIFIVGSSGILFSIKKDVSQDDILFFWLLFGISTIFDKLLFFLPYYFVIKTVFFLIIFNNDICSSIKDKWLDQIEKIYIILTRQVKSE